MPRSQCQHVNASGVACPRAEVRQRLCLGHLNAPRVRALPLHAEKGRWRNEGYRPSRTDRLQRTG